MPAEPPPDVARSAVESGAKKAGETWDHSLVGAFLAVHRVRRARRHHGLVRHGLVRPRSRDLGNAADAVHRVRLNMMLVPISAMHGRITLGDAARNLTLVLLGNLVGAVFVAYFFAVQTGVIGDAGSEPGSPPP